MPVETVRGDLLSAFDAGIDVIGHQVNMRGVMGRGVARQIKERWPSAYRDYHHAIKMGWMFLGDIWVSDMPEGHVAHIAGQQNYGSGLQTDYTALETGLRELFATAKEKGWRVALPHGIGCGLGGGDWARVEGSIRSLADAYGVSVTLYRFDG